MGKIKVTNPIVEIDGDEMARIMWHMIKEHLILPYIDLPIKYFDLAIESRDKTDDKITIAAAQAAREYKVAIKCATITVTLARQVEFNLKRVYPSPNGTIRDIIGGTIFREPIIISNIPRIISNWKRPICIGRHAFADQYKATDIKVKQGDELILKVKRENGVIKEFNVCQFKDSSGVALAMYNNTKSIKDFATACFNMALVKKWPLYLSTKNTVLKVYDGEFVKVFFETYKDEFEKRFKEVGITYEHRLIDDMVAYALKSAGGFVWACKNYDGDIQSDFIAQGFGSLGLMSSTLISADGRVVEAEAAHGTVTRHYHLYRQGKKTSTNPIASIFAWNSGLKYRAQLDHNKDLTIFTEKLENAVIKTVESGFMTKDLASLLKKKDYLHTEEFILKIKTYLDKTL